jgi:hypothetical protein
MVEKANAAGSDISAQVFPRPIGLMIGLELTANPFVLYPSYQEIAHLPLAERVAEMRKLEVRARILADKPGSAPANPLVYLAQAWEWIFPLDERADYEPDRSMSIWPGRRLAGSPRWRRPMTGCSTTTDTRYCSARWPISRTIRSTPLVS